jgi:hypothetical protein
MLTKIFLLRFGVFAAVTMKNTVFLNVTFVRTDFSEERILSIIRVNRISEIGTMLSVTINRSTLRRNSFLHSVFQLLVTTNVVPSSLIVSTLTIEAIRSSETFFSQEPHGVTFQKTAFFTGPSCLSYVHDLQS